MKRSLKMVSFGLSALLVSAALPYAAMGEATKETSPQKQAQPSSQSLEVRMGKLRKFVKEGNSVVGVVLSDGTTASLPPDIGATLYKLNQTGEMVMVTGYQVAGKFETRSIAINGIQRNIPEPATKAN